MIDIPLAKTDPDYKKIAIVAAMINKKKYLNDTIKSINDFILYFSDYHPGRKTINLSKSCDAIWLADDEIKFSYKFNSTPQDLEWQNEFAARLIQSPKNLFSKPSTFSFNSANNGKIVQNENKEREINKGNELVNFLMFLEESPKLRSFMAFLTRFCSNSNSIALSARQFYKLKRNSWIVEEVTAPSKSVRSQLLDLIANYKKGNIQQIRHSIFDIRGTTPISLSLLGIPIMTEISFKRFLYMDHPGFNFMADYLDKINGFRKFNSAIQKEIIKTI